MNSEWCINKWLLIDPSRVDEVFDMGFTIDMFSQEQTANDFYVIVKSWYDHWCRPLECQLDYKPFLPAAELPYNDLATAVTYVKERCEQRQLRRLNLIRNGVTEEEMLQRFIAEALGNTDNHE